MRNFFLGLMTALFFLVGCSQVDPKTLEGKYNKALMHMEKGEYSLAQPLLQSVTREAPGTRYANYSYLHLGDTFLETASDSTRFAQAEVNYQVFLRQNPTSHLVPYVMSRLIELHFRKNDSSFFGKDYAYSRDPGHFKAIIREYQRFYMLYPQSTYLDQARKYRDQAVEALAEHELLIGDWYYEQGHYPSAIARYRYTLDNYPNFARKLVVMQRLVEAYEMNQQPDLAKEITHLMQKVQQSS